jgi:hypothetical protein
VTGKAARKATLPGPAGPPEPAAGPDPQAAQLADVVAGLTRQNSLYRRMITVCDELAAATLKGAGALELTRLFAELLGKRVVLLDPAFSVRGQAGGRPGGPRPPWDPGDPTIGRLLRTLAAEGRPVRAPAVPGSVLGHGCLATPITVGTDGLGFLLVLDEGGPAAPDDVDLQTVTYAATLFALTLARERTSTELGLRYQGALIGALVSGHFLDSGDALRKAESLGVAGRPFRVGVVSASPAAGPSGAGELARRLTASATGIVAAVRDAEVVLILPEEPGPPPSPGPRRPPSGPPAAATALRASWRGIAGQGGVTCGLSERIRHPDQAPRGLRQAEHAVDLGIRLGRAGDVVCYDELGIYRLLLLIDEMGQLWQFAGEILGALIEYDATHRLDLIGTLSVYLSEHASLKQTARRLRVHANTVAYRIRRVEELTGLDLGDADDRLLAHVSVKIIESQQGVAPLTDSPSANGQPSASATAQAPGDGAPPGTNPSSGLLPWPG